MNSIGDTHSVKQIVGNRIKQARKDKGLSRIALAKGMCASSRASQEMTASKYVLEELEKRLEARIRQWESGANPVDIEWIPAICDVLSCDVGYLFGDYDGHTRVFADITRETGLSEDAIKNIVKVKSLNQEYVDALSAFVEDSNLEYFLYLIGKRIKYTDMEEKRKNIGISDARKWYEAIRETEINIPFDGSMLYAKKTNLLDSLIGTSITSRMNEITRLYISKKEGEHNG